MSSNSPSGGMNEIVLSVSNLASFTHWWNWQSSSVTLPAFALAVLFVWSRPLYQLQKITKYPETTGTSEPSKRRESFSPNRHSGVPERYALIIIVPFTSARKAVPELIRDMN